MPGIDVWLFAEYGPKVGQCSFAKPVQSHVLFHNKPIIRNWLRRYDYAREKPNFSPDFLFGTRLCRKHNRHTRFRSVTPACHTLLSCPHQSSSPRRITAAGAGFIFFINSFWAQAFSQRPGSARLTNFHLLKTKMYMFRSGIVTRVRRNRPIRCESRARGRGLHYPSLLQYCSSSYLLGR